MSWIEQLYQTYGNCEDQIGVQVARGDVQEAKGSKTPLLPICHTTQQAHIKIILDGNGQFRRAQVIEKVQSATITPCTEQSGGRAGKKPVPHPLFDKLQYIAGDFVEFGGEVTIGFASNPVEPYEEYMRALTEWCESPYRHSKVCTILTYLKKKQVIHDLVQHKVLYVGENGKLLYQWLQEDDEGTPPIFKLLSGKVNAKGERQPWQADAFVKFAVETHEGDSQSDLESDSTAWESWVNYYASTKSAKALCFVSGKEDFAADQHPAKIRNSGDKAKLISSNDTSGFTFRGRFLSDSEACGVSFEVSHKAHNALRWLIDRQGWRNGDLAFVAWAVHAIDVPDPMADTWDLNETGAEEEIVEEPPKKSDTAQVLGNKLSKLLAGYAAKLGKTDKVVFMGLNSATPGRMAIIYYRELTGSEFLERVQRWHAECRWLQRYSKDKIFVGAPAPKDIARAAFGTEVDTKLLNATVERLIPCIIDGMAIPRDLIDSTVRRACKRQSVDAWEWEKTLGIACALYKYAYHKKEDCTMPLDHTRTSRDYLYGRLLAIADCLEGFALSGAEKDRPTNAARLMQRFADHPYSTWRTIELALASYKARLGYKARKYDVALEEVMGLFETDDFIRDAPLSGEFLLSFHKQRTELYQSSAPENTEEEQQQ